MAAPAERFSTAARQAEQELLPLRLPAVLALAPVPPAPADQPQDRSLPAPAAAGSPPGPIAAARWSSSGWSRPAGTWRSPGRQFWLGPDRAGMTVTFWASTEVIHLSIAGARVKSVRSHLSAADLARARRPGAPARRAAAAPRRPSPAPRSRSTGSVSKDGAVSLGGRYVLAAEILGGPLVSASGSSRTP